MKIEWNVRAYAAVYEPTRVEKIVYIETDFPRRPNPSGPNVRLRVRRKVLSLRRWSEDPLAISQVRDRRSHKARSQGGKWEFLLQR